MLIDYQRVWAEVNLDNISHNIRQVQSFIGENTEIMAIIKADAYGHGAVETSKVMLYNGATSLGVATCDEGIALRQNNIFADILVLGYTPKKRFEEIVKNNLTQTIFCYETAALLSDISIKQGQGTKARVSIKIDTGMARIGFTPTEKTVEEIIKISKLPNIIIEDIYSHLAMSETFDKSFTYEQYNKFEYIINSLKQKGITNFKKHICNSGAILNNKDIYMDMVRPGIILYGLFPSSEVDATCLNLKPAMSLKTKVSYLKTLPKGVSVGYDRAFFTQKETRVATLPVGYADGYPRALSNKGHVIIGNGYAPIIGRVCMDQMMVDVTNIHNVKEEDEVILIGKKGNMEITADEIANLEQSISREVMCNIGKRVPRIYIKDGKVLKVVNL